MVANSSPAPDGLKPARAQRIEAALQVLAPTRLVLRDESHLHAGHNPAAVQGETHYRLHLASLRFVGLSRVARQRLVNDLLRDEFASGLHALALHLDEA